VKIDALTIAKPIKGIPETAASMIPKRETNVIPNPNEYLLHLAVLSSNFDPDIIIAGPRITIIITNTTPNNANAKPLIPVDGKPSGDVSYEVYTEGLE
jgi:hypothetical protein